MNQSENFSAARFSKIFEILKRGKWIIAGTVGIFWIGAILLAILSTSVYESWAVFKVGSRYAAPDEIKIVESNSTISYRFWRQYPTKFSQSAQNNFAYLHELKDSTVEVTQFMVKVRARTAIDAQRFLAEILNQLLEGHRLLSNRPLLEETITHLDQQLLSLRSRTSRNKSRIEELIQDNPSLAVVTMLQQKDLQRRLEETKVRLVEANSLLAELLQNQSEIVKAPTLPEHRVAPDVHFYLVAATLLGLALGWITAVAASRRAPA